MRKASRLMALAAGILVIASGCGSDPAPVAQQAATPPPAAAGSPTIAATTAAGLTPEQVCALVDIAQMSRISAFTITGTKPEMSGNVAVCHYVGTAGDNFSSSRVLLEYQPDGKTAVEYTKSKGEAVAGLGQFAVYFQTSGQLSVEIGGDAVFHVFIQDLRAGQNDPKGAAIQVAQIAVPRLPHA